MEFLNIGGFNRKRLQKIREKEKAEAEEQAKLEQMEQAEVSGDNNKIYLIAGAVAVLGAVIIIIKTRKK